VKFCNLCAGPLALQIPEDDERERHVCQNCGHIHYINPKVIVGCLPTVGDRILMCKRAIEPRYGKWTLPAGFMENGETSAGGAARETWEEAAAKAIDLELYRIFDVPHISQVYLFYRCGIENDEFGVGPESLESALYSEDEIPWDEIAFPTVKKTLKFYLEDLAHSSIQTRVLDIQFEERLKKTN